MFGLHQPADRTGCLEACELAALVALVRLRRHELVARELGWKPSVVDDVLRAARHKAGARDDLELVLLALAEGSVLLPAAGAARPPDRLGALSTAELDVARLIARHHLTNGEIACRLHLGIKAVEQRVSRALRKTGSRNRTELAAVVLRSDDDGQV